MTNHNAPEPGVPAHASATWVSLPADAWHSFVGETWEPIVA